jgi:amino acid adenylation domain-containing protein/FkbM family methyltransferase
MGGKDMPSQLSGPQYVDYAVWEQSTDGQNSYNEGVNYWVDKLANSPSAITFPKLKGFSESGNKGAIFSDRVDSITLSAIKENERMTNTTLFTHIFSALSATLHRYTNATDIVIGSAFANRAVCNTDKMVGFFVNPVPLRVTFGNGVSFSELFKLSNTSITEAIGYQSTPMIKTVEQRDKNSELFKVMVTLQNNKSVIQEFAGGRFDILEVDKSVSENDVTLNLWEEDGELNCKWIYKTSKYDNEYIKAISDAFKTLLLAFAGKTNVEKVGELDLSERLQGSRHDYPISRIEDIIKKQVNKTPDTIALKGASRQIKYCEFENETNQLANYLTEMGITKGDNIGVLMSRDVEVSLAFFAINKVGAVYVPLDINNPKERISGILKSANIKAVLTNKQSVADEITSIDVVNIKDSKEDIDDFSTQFVGNDQLSYESPCYIIHTSGSTGKPKGVVVTHKNLCSYISHVTSTLLTDDRKNSFVSTSIAFDATLTSLLAPLAIGGTVEFVSDGNEIDFLTTIASIEHPSLFKLTPSHIDALMNSEVTNEIINTKHSFVIGGEALRVETSKFLGEKFPNSKIVNEYGPTEATVGCVSAELSKSTHEYSTCEIGYPHANTAVEIVSPEGGRQPLFAGGELILFGDNIASGYLVDGELNKAAFSYNDTVKYKSGDICFSTDNAGLVFVCREDKQLKIRGYRIETEEISSVIKKNDAIDDVVVTTLGKDDTSLVAFCKLNTARHPELSATIKAYNVAKEKGVNLNLFPMPDGSHMLGINRLETEYLHEEIIRDATYNKHGITLDEGACVFDVGANIGFFSHYLSATFKDIKIFSFEPIGPVYDVLNANASRTGNKITAINEGLSFESSKTVFSYYPNVTVFSGVQQGHEESVDTIRGFLKHTNNSLDDGDVHDLLETRFKSIDVPVSLSTLSSHVDAHSITKIDLLKIDVERFEMNVLKGIRNEHWAIIDQIIIEVHNQDDNVLNVKSLLDQHNFTYIVDQNTELGGTELINIYARKIDMPKVSSSFSYKESTTADGINAIISNINNLAEQNLPTYMVPKKIALFSEWPLTQNGKIDTGKLSKLFNMSESNSNNNEQNPLDTPTEKTLGFHISSILTLEQEIFKGSNFFEVGGDSISVMKLVANIRTEWAIEISLKEIYGCDNISDIAKLIDIQLALTSMSQDIEEDGSEMEF